MLIASCSVKAQDDFDRLNALPDWELKFSDSCTENWQNSWFLDGEIARVEQSQKGMNLIAGPINRNDAHHSVLWTKESFKGDLKIEYNYTRTDTQVVNVNILFIQATGIGKDDFDKDITKWNDYRKVPTMSKYWLNMNAIHISFSAFPMVNEDPENDYIRVRRYPAETRETFEATKVLPAYFKTGLFKTGVTYKMVWIKSGAQLLLSVTGDDISEKFEWDLSAFEPLEEGRIGLRHMFTRSANYRDFKVYSKY